MKVFKSTVFAVLLFNCEMVDTRLIHGDKTMQIFRFIEVKHRQALDWNSFISLFLFHRDQVFCQYGILFPIILWDKFDLDSLSVYLLRRTITLESIDRPISNFAIGNIFFYLKTSSKISYMGPLLLVTQTQNLKIL